DRRAKWAVAAAAVLLLGVIGAGVGSLASNGGLWLPGEPLPSLRLAQAAKEPAAGATPREGQIQDQHRRLEGVRGDGTVTEDSIGQPNAAETDTTAFAVPRFAPSPKSSPAGG